MSIYTETYVHILFSCSIWCFLSYMTKIMCQHCFAGWALLQPSRYAICFCCYIFHMWLLTGLDSFYAYIGLLIILLATNFIVFYMHLKHVKSIVFFYVSVVLLGLAHTLHLLFFRYIFFTYNNYYREDHLGPQLF